MSFSAELWEQNYTDALASLYDPFVMGLANGDLPQAAFVEYIQQDYFYLDIYEKAYQRAIELSREMGNDELLNTFSELIKGITDEKNRHVNRASERDEDIKLPQILRATKGYTDLLTKAFTEGSLAEIVAAILPCNKLYDFIGHEIQKSIPDHNHKYSEWINTYANEGMTESSKTLERILDSLVTEANKESARFYYSEAMRLEFEFFNQQNHVFASPITKIMSIAAGTVCCGSEVNVDSITSNTREGLIAFASTLTAPASCPKCDTWREKLVSMCVDYGKTVTPLSAPATGLTLGFGCFAELPALLQTDLAVLVSPSASEITAVERCGLKVKRLLTAASLDLNALPKDTVFFVEHVFEVGMMTVGSAFYPNQHFDTLPTTLIIAGSDSGGGAGMQADMKACAALGSYSVTVFTALTAQNTKGAQRIFMVPEDLIADQMDSVCTDFAIDAVKTGMMGTKEVAHLIAEKLKQYPVKRLVVDPCMICRSGNKIMAEDAVPTVRDELIPQALIITPNYFEASTLLEREIPHTVEGIKQAAMDLRKLGCKNVYLKGGPVEGSDEACDVLCLENGECEIFTVPYVQTRNTHGTGCTLASSIAAELSKGLSVMDAVKEAKRYVNEGVIASRFLHVGKGKQGPLNHLYRTFPCVQH